jgi:hypothetical protein
MKILKNLLIVILLKSNYLYCQKPVQQWINVLNSSNASNDFFKGGTSKAPVSISSKGTKVSLTYNVDNLAAMSVLNSANGAIEHVNKSSIATESKSIIFDSSDNIICLSTSGAWGNNLDAIFKKFNSLTGIVEFEKTINNYADDNAQTILNSNSGFLINTLNRTASDSKLSHSIYKFDKSGVLQWNSSITDYDWYYGYEGKVTKDINENIILSGKRHLSGTPNKYDIVIRKLNSNGVQQWQVYYDYNNLMDVMCNRSLITDLNGDVYFVDANSNNWSGTTYRLVKLSAKDGTIIYQQEIGTTSVSDLLINKDGNIIVNALNEVRCYNNLNGQLNWKVAISEINSINSDKSGNIYVASKSGINILDSNGKILNTTSVAISGFTINHLYVLTNEIGNEFYVFGNRVANGVNKIFVSKFSLNSCTTPLATITPKGATTFLSGGSTELTATTGANYTYEWYLNNVVISGATTASYKATASGSYTVKVMNGTCSATSTPVVIKVVPKLSEGVITVVAPPTVKQNGLVEVVLSTSTLDSLHKVIAYQTDFSYDSTRFTYVSSSLVGTLNPTGTVQVNSSLKGRLSIGYMSPKLVVGTGSLVKLTFKASLVMGSTPFGLSNFLYNATPVTKLVGDTISIIDGIPPTGKITYSVNPARKGDSLIITVAFNEKMALSPIPQLELTGQNVKPKTNMTRINETTYQLIHVVEKGSGIVNVRLYTGTDLAKNIVTALPTTGVSFSVIPPVYGDIDTNKMIQAYDAAIALQYSVGLNAISHIDPSPWSNWRVVGANVDTVSGVTANDASLILQKSVGQLSSFPADGLKRSVQEMGDVEIIQVKDQLLFKAKGNLQGFNFNVKDIQGVLGAPEFVNTEMMVAENRNGSDFRIGIAKAGKFKDGEIFMKINLNADAPVKLLASINVNTRKVERLIDGNIVSKTKYVNVKDINVYPNPAKNSVTISGAEGYDLTIFNIEGRKVYSSLLDTDYFQAQFKDSLPTGLYIIKLSSENDNNTEEYKLMVE